MMAHWCCRRTRRWYKIHPRRADQRRNLPCTLHFQCLRFHWSFRKRTPSSDKKSKRHNNRHFEQSNIKTMKNLPYFEIKSAEPRKFWKNQRKHLHTHFLYAWTYIHSWRCVSMLSFRNCSSPFSSIFTTLPVTYWHTVHTLWSILAFCAAFYANRKLCPHLFVSRHGTH